MGIRILTDSTCDMPLEYVKHNSDLLDIVGMPIHIDTKDFIDDLGQTVPHEEFYSMLREGKMATTSQISPTEFLRVFTKNHKNGHSTFYVGFSSGLSGTFNNAVLARGMILEEFPDAEVTVVDTLSASLGQGLLLSIIIEMTRNGAAMNELEEWLTSHIQKTQHWFAVDDLNYLKNGGRIPASSAVIGTMLNIKPILTVLPDGKLEKMDTVRGRKKSMKYLVEKVTSHRDMLLFDKIIIGHGNCPDDAAKLKELIEKDAPELEVMITELSATISSHVGPDMIAVTFIGGQRPKK